MPNEVQRGQGAVVLRCHSCSFESRDVWPWVRLAIGAFLAMNVMTFSLSVNLSEVSARERLILQSVLLAATVAIAAVAGAELFVNAWKELRRRRVTIEALFLLGVGGAMGQSVLAMARASGPVYFEVASILLVVYALGRHLVARSQQSAISALECARKEFTCTRLRADGQAEVVPASRLERGDVVVVKPGERIPADGTVISGAACTREAHLTGEAFLASKRSGDFVLADTYSEDGVLHIRVLAPPASSEAFRTLDEVESSLRKPASVERAADRLARWFAPVVFTAGLATTIGWGLAADWPAGLMNGLSVLLVACPCAMGFATPLAFCSAIRRLSDFGLSVRGGETIERLATADTVVFDKTGTMTEESWRVAEARFFETGGLDEARIRQITAAAEIASNHPVAAAFSGFDAGLGNNPFVVKSLQTIAGVGFRATVREGATGPAREVTVGLADALADRGHAVPRAGESQHRRIAVLVDGAPAASVAVEEQLHPSAAAAMERLRGAGLRTIVATGDALARAQAIIADEHFAGMKPTEKSKLAQELQAAGRRVLFVGDGLNDAAAMAASHASIAAAGSVDLTAGVAGAVMAGGNLSVIPRTIEVCREALSVARTNLYWAAAYNTAGIAIAAAGLLHPVTATVIMTCSSLFVSWRASRLLPQEETAETVLAKG